MRQPTKSEFGIAHELELACSVNDQRRTRQSRRMTPERVIYSPANPTTEAFKLGGRSAIHIESGDLPVKADICAHLFAFSQFRGQSSHLNKRLQSSLAHNPNFPRPNRSMFLVKPALGVPA
jgi:hypothetical protein